MATGTRWGVLLPTFDALHTGRTPPLLDGARAAEALGFDSGWVGDHLACNAPLLDSASALAAAAAVTDRLALGFSVMLLGLRDPAQAAAQVMTLQALSGNRLALGVGVGGEHPEEFAAAGVSARRRGRLLDAGLDALLDPEGPASLTGHPDLARPRVIVGGRGEPALRRAARAGDGWMPMWLSPQRIADRAAALNALTDAAGRPRLPLTLMMLVHVDPDRQTARRRAAEHLLGQYRLELEVVERWALLGDVLTVAEGLGAYLAAGVGEFILMAVGPDALTQYERLAEVRELVAGAPDPT